MTPSPPITHPETAWLALAVTPALTAGALLVVGLLLRGRIAQVVAQLQARRLAARHAGGGRPDPALLWLPAVVAPERLVAACLGVAAASAAVLTLAAPPALALLAGCPATALAAWSLLALAERRYVGLIDQDLTAAVGRLSALLRGGSGLRQGLERVLEGLPPGPLRDEWAFLLTRKTGCRCSGTQRYARCAARRVPTR